MIEPKLLIRCPCCNAEIELQARPVQAELPLGPIELTPAKQNKLDGPPRDLGTIERFADSDFSDDSNSSDSKTLTERDSNRIVSSIASCEEDLIESLRNLVGEKEWALNGPGWRWRVQNHSKALCYAIEDFKMRTPEQRSKIQNRAAWLTDRFKRALIQVEAKRKTA